MAGYPTSRLWIRAAVAAVALAAATLTLAGPAAAGTLERPIDRVQQTTLSFGDRSHWLQPWRAYLDTVPAEKLTAAMGINFNVPATRAEATARLLAQAGFRRARIEVGWSSVDFADRDRLRANDDHTLRTRLTALRNNGIRPLILLNAHHGAPTPYRFFPARLVEPAEKGDRTIRVDASTAEASVPGRTGLNATYEYKAAAILFTAVLPDGTVALSKPLPRRLEAGDHPAATLAFAPFRRPRLAGGAPNPAFEETLSGWLRYVDVVTRRAREVLGSTEFDVEVWNELSFGSDFLDARDYYDPPPEIGIGSTDREILERTVAFIRAPGRNLGGVGIGNGFASERPWEAGSTSPPGLTAIDKHPYKNMLRLPGGRLHTNQRPLDAEGRPNGTLIGQDLWREDFIPTYNAFFPEYYLSAIQTEHMVRDLSPITTDVYGTPHGRNTHPPGSPPPELWITEAGMNFGEAEPTEPPDPEGDPLREVNPVDAAHLRAKATLRATTAFVNKGVSALYFFAAQGSDFGLIEDAFFDEVDRGGGAFPGPDGAGPTIAAISRMLRRFDAPARIGRRRELSLNRISDDHDQRQFAGNGTASRPPLYNREVLAFLPFQLADHSFVASVYVMTRDLARVNRPELGASDARRFDLPAAPYRLTIGNLDAATLRGHAYDPLTDTQVEVQIVSRAGDRAVVEIPVTDSPRLLFLDDSPRPAADTAQPRGSGLRVTAVRMRRNRLLIRGHAGRPGRVGLVIRLRGRKSHLIRRRIPARSGRLNLALRLPRPARHDRSISRAAVVARTAAGVHRSSWRL